MLDLTDRREVRLSDGVLDTAWLAEPGHYHARTTPGSVSKADRARLQRLARKAGNTVHFSIEPGHGLLIEVRRSTR